MSTAHKLKVIFVNKDASETEVDVEEGLSLLEIAHINDIDLEGACEGSLACSTCHVIVENMEDFDKLDPATDEEEDMLDLAFALTEKSRLGCQIIMLKELDGIKVRIPASTRNVSG